MTLRTEVNVNTVAVMIREEHHTQTLNLKKLMNISRTSVNQILTKNLAMRRVFLVWTPHFLRNALMNDCVAVCQENLGLIEDIPDFLDHVLRRKLGALLLPKIETRNFALEITRFSAKTEGAPAEIGKGAHGGFFDS